MTTADPHIDVTLADRALFALADREEGERLWLLGQAERACLEVLKVAMPEPEKVELRERRVSFSIDDILLRAQVKTVNDSVNSGGSIPSNASIEGMNTSEVTVIETWHRSAWIPIHELADLGRIVRAQQELAA